MILWCPKSSSPSELRRPGLWRKLPRCLQPDSFRANSLPSSYHRRRADKETNFTWVAELSRMPAGAYDTLVRAFAIVLAHAPQSTLVVRGEPFLESRVLRLARNLGIASNVGFVGTDRIIAPLVHAKDAVVLQMPRTPTSTPNVFVLKSARSLADAMLREIVSRNSADLDLRTQFDRRKGPAVRLSAFS